jgi:hypothetical protein
MEADLLSQITIVTRNFYDSAFFGVIKFILIVYTIVLVIDIVLVIILKGFGEDIRVLLKGMNVPAVPKGRMMKKWNAIREHLETDNVSQFKVAVLEADNLIDRILEKMGYKGKNMSERLDKIKPGQLEYLEEIREAHKIRNQIIHEKDFMINRKKTEEVLATYEKLLRNLEFLS